jgi:putative ABC transport system permease protein
VNAVGFNYFKTLRVPLLRGRDFTGRDDIKAPPVAIVNESFAREFFPGQDPIGKRITPDGSVTPGDPPVRQIVGVVGDSRLISLSTNPKPQIYVPHQQFAAPAMSLFVRTQNVPLYRPRLLSDYVSSSIAQPRFNAVLVSLFSAVALLLAAAGIFGVMSYTVTQRTHEIGIRLALGAQRSDVLRLIFGEGMRLVALGVVLGITSVFAIRRLLGSLLYGIGATDPIAILSVTMLLAAVAFIACWLPARRASGVDPTIALRTE